MQYANEQSVFIEWLPDSIRVDKNDSNNNRISLYFLESLDYEPKKKQTKVEKQASHEATRSSTLSTFFFQINFWNELYYVVRCVTIRRHILSFSVFDVLLVSVDCRCCEPCASDGMSHLQLTRSIHEIQSRFLLCSFWRNHKHLVFEFVWNRIMNIKIKAVKIHAVSGVSSTILWIHHVRFSIEKH